MVHVQPCVHSHLLHIHLDVYIVLKSVISSLKYMQMITHIVYALRLVHKVQLVILFLMLQLTLALTNVTGIF